MEFDYVKLTTKQNSNFKAINPATIITLKEAKFT